MHLFRKSRASYISKTLAENLEKQLDDERKARERLEKEIEELKSFKDTMKQHKLI